MSEVLDQKLLKSAIIHYSEAQWYLVCTKVVRHIRAVLFWIIYDWSAHVHVHVLVKQFITFLFSWPHLHFVVKVVILIAVVHNCA